MHVSRISINSGRVSGGVRLRGGRLAEAPRLLPRCGGDTVFALVEIATLTRENGKTVIRVLKQKEVEQLIKKHEEEEAKAEREKKEKEQKEKDK